MSLDLLAESMRRYGIPANDVVGKRLFTAWIEGIWEVLSNKKNVDYILQQAATPHDPRMVELTWAVIQDIVTQRLIDTYKSITLYKLLLFLTSRNLGTTTSRDFILDLVWNHQSRIQLQVWLDLDINNTSIVDDPYGYVRADFVTREVEVCIKYDAIMLLHALSLEQGWSQEPITDEEICVMALCHEFMHVTSTELPDALALSDRKKIFEIRNSVQASSEEELFSQRYYQYRSGYNYIFLDGSYVKLTPIDEAITEIMAAEFYNSLLWSSGFENLKNPYRIVYSRYVARFYEAMDALSGWDKAKQEQMMELIRHGYFHGGEAWYRALMEVIQPMEPYFDDIDNPTPKIIT